MNITRPFAKSGNPFKPAFQYLALARSLRPDSSVNLHRRGSSLDDLDDDVEYRAADMEGPTSRASHSSKNSFSELQPGVPLIDISRTPSPYPRSRSAAQSEDEDDDFEPASSIRPLVSSDIGSGGNTWKRVFRSGGLGNFFFGTWMGWQMYVGLLVFWVGGCGFGLLLMNRFILWSMSFTLFSVNVRPLLTMGF